LEGPSRPSTSYNYTLNCKSRAWWYTVANTLVPS